MSSAEVNIIMTKLDAIMAKQREIYQTQLKAVEVLYETGQVKEGMVTATTACKMLNCKKSKLMQLDKTYSIRDESITGHHRYRLDKIYEIM